MKPLSILVAVLIIMSSCNNPGNEVTRITAERDSLKGVISDLQSQLPEQLEISGKDITATLDKYSNMPDKIFPSMRISAADLNDIYQTGKNLESIRITFGTTKDNIKTLDVEYTPDNAGYAPGDSSECAHVQYPDFLQNSTMKLNLERCCVRCPPLDIFVFSREFPGQ